MIEGITGYLILALFFSLFFIGLVALSAKFKKPIRGSSTMKVNRDTVIKGLAAAGFILFSRKLIYYIPFDGVIQTKFSIWWVEENAQSLLFISILILLLTGIGWLMFKIHRESAIVFVVFFGVTSLMIILYFATLRNLISILLAPLVMIKMLLPGKYPGLLTSFLLGYVIVGGYKILIPIISKNQKIKFITPAMFLIVVLMLLIFWGVNVDKSSRNPGNWDQQLNNKLLSISGESDIVNLLDAVHSIYREDARFQILEPIAALIVKEKEFRWKKEIYQRVIDEVTTLAGYRSSRLLRKIVLWIAKTGDIPWATAVAEKIPDMKIRTSALETIRIRIEKK